MKLTVSNIAKAYEGRVILKDCSYSFDRNGTYVLMGPNGCGKSTLLRICALLEQADGGTVTYGENGAVLQPDMALRRRITLVLPRIGVFNTTVSRNVAYSLRVRGIAHAEIESRVNKTLAFVGLDQKKTQQARTLSSGETQRLGIARALVLDPEVLFLDEPTASIDEENTRIIESIINDMRKQNRSKVIMTTHDHAQAERIADRMLVLEHGILKG
ncbi:MAG: ATP-binding cassette domain-containing protein [Nitrospirae bacterium]|nr:ATP-binding cassette domain-containing protein [Nitrospirota bacterium]